MRICPLVVALLLGVLTGCSGSTPPATAPTTASSSATASASPTPAVAQPHPRVGACHRLGYAAAVAPTDERRTVPCRKPHTTVTFAVGRLDDLSVVDGHLLAVDAAGVQRRLAATCPEGLARFVGATEEQLRLTMVRAIWFSPTVAGAAEGQDRYRCDATVLAAEDRLLTLRAPDQDLAGALATDAGRQAYGMCGTADPASARFRRVVCSADHSWEAVATTDASTDASYPGVAALTKAGTDACEDPARARASDPLTVTWSYEPPTRAQWRAGQHYGICWVPSGV